MFDFSCPSCGKNNIRFFVVKSLSKTAIVRCRSCGFEVKSESTPGMYLVFLIYVQAVVFVVAVPFVLAIAGGKWSVAIVAFVVFAALVIPPAMMLHARNIARIRNR
jgi:uncharacterized protein (DUF983 family)